MMKVMVAFRLIITLCVLEMVVTKSLKDTSGPLGDCYGLALSRGDPRGRDRWGGAVLRHTTEDLQPHKKLRSTLIKELIFQLNISRN